MKRLLGILLLIGVFYYFTQVENISIAKAFVVMAAALALVLYLKSTPKQIS